MKLCVQINYDPRLEARLDGIERWQRLTLERINVMATKEQLDKLRVDVAALITAGVAEITAAVAAAQTASPDPAIDQLDTDVTAATANLTAAAAKLTTPPA